MTSHTQHGHGSVQQAIVIAHKWGWAQFGVVSVLKGNPGLELRCHNKVEREKNCIV